MDVSDADELGTLERVGDVSVLRYERRLAHPPERVWRALTDDAELADWFPTTMEGERQKGAALRYSSPRPSWSCAGPTTSCASSSSRTGRDASCACA